MKLRRYILGALAAAAGLFASCSNDDITITYESQVTVNSSSVINSFDPWSDGDLELLSSGYKLRIRLLAYNAEGMLMANDSVFLDNWTSQARLQPRLAPGTYTLYAITDVVRYSNSKMTREYWSLENRDKLSTVKLVDAGWIANQHKIMGIGHQTLTVTETGGSASITVEPAGTLFLIYYANIHAYNNVGELGVAIQKNGDYLTFDGAGNYTASFVSDGTSFTTYRMDVVDPSDFTANNVYSYQFELPTKNYALKFKIGYTKNGMSNLSYFYSRGFTLDLEPGAQYRLFMDLAESENNYAEECFLFNDDEEVKPWQANGASLVKPQFAGQRKSVYLTEYE